MNKELIYPSSNFYKLVKNNVDEGISFVVKVQKKNVQRKISLGRGFLFEEDQDHPSPWWIPIIMSITANNFLSAHFYTLGNSYKAILEENHEFLIRYYK